MEWETNNLGCPLDENDPCGVHQGSCEKKDSNTDSGYQCQCKEDGVDDQAIMVDCATSGTPLGLIIEFQWKNNEEVSPKSQFGTAEWEALRYVLSSWIGLDEVG